MVTQQSGMMIDPNAPPEPGSPPLTSSLAEANNDIVG
jgi:hypothetical protein